MRVTIELERNPMPALEWTRVRTTVRNLADRTLLWGSDGCGTPVSVSGEMNVAWRPGIEQTGVASTFKETVLGLGYRATPPPGPLVRFVPNELVGEGYGCADLMMGHEIAAGEAIHDERVWGGQADLRWGPPPDGPIRLTGVFDWFRHRGERSSAARTSRIAVELEAWIEGGADESWLSPPEIVDAALADPDFVTFLEGLRLGSGIAEILWYRPNRAVWEVGVLDWGYGGEKDMLHLVLVDPHTGEIRATVDREWDEEKDGAP